MRSRIRALLLLAPLCGGCLLPPERRGEPSPREVEIHSITPNAGPRTGGTRVTVTGRGFGAQPFVTLGISNVETFVQGGDEIVVFDAPPDAVGPASLTIVNEEGGRATAIAAFFYLPLPAVAYERRFFADSPDEAGANTVLVSTTAQSITSLDIDVPRADTGAIAGRLTDENGAPLVGHDVVATGAAGTVATLSGLDGAYLLDGLPPGAWTLRTDEAADSPLADQAWPGVTSSLEAEPITVVAGSTVEGAHLVLSPGGTLRGVVSGDGPLEGALVSASPLDGNSLQFSYTTTDALGAYEIDGLAPGDYRVVATAFGSGRVTEYWPDALAPGDAAPVTIDAGAIASADFALDEGGSISGTVVEDPSLAPGPLPGVVVVAHDVDRGLDWSTASAGTGAWTVAALPPGRYRIEAPELGIFYPGVTGTAGATVFDVQAGDALQDVTLLGRIGTAACGDPDGTGTVTGLATDADGDPLLRATTILVPATGGSLAFATTGRDGAWTADCVEPGVYVLRTSAANTRWILHEDATGLAVGTGAVAAPAARLPTGSVLSGTVRDAETNEPLVSTPVRVRNPATGAAAVLQTDPNGRWQAEVTSLGGVAPGSWVVEALPTVRGEHSPD